MPQAAPPAPPPAPLMDAALEATWLRAMELALAQARLAATQGEAPVGAVVLSPDGHVLSQAANAPIAQNDPTAHAEILALRAAGAALGNYRLTGCTLVCTLEPCLMCVGAAIHARVAGIVYGASDPKAGAVASRLEGAALDFVNHRFWRHGGLLADECSQVLKDFFKSRR